MLRGSKGADEALVEALYKEHAAPLYAVALRLTGDREKAGEVVQETFLRAWRHPEAIDGSLGSARAWLFTVARNLVRDGWRRERARPTPSRTPIEEIALAAGNDDLEWAAEGAMVAEAVAGLSREHRSVLLHVFHYGHSVAETATALGVPPGTVKSRTYYALRSLRLALEEKGMQS